MNGVIPGLGGCANCQNCAAPNPCAGAAPIITVCGSGSGYAGVPGAWAAYSSGQYLTGATWSATSLPSGVTINSSTGFLVGTVSAAGTYNISVTATNGCGSATCTFVLTIAACSCPITLSASGGPDSYSNTVATTGCGPVHYTYDMFTIDSDQLLVYADAALVYDSGCVLGTGSGTFIIPPGTAHITVIVNANCAGPTASVWSFSLFCV